MYGIVGGFGIGLPPVLHFGSDELKQRIVPPCVKGEKRICLAITEVSPSSVSTEGEKLTPMLFTPS